MTITVYHKDKFIIQLCDKIHDCVCSTCQKRQQQQDDGFSTFISDFEHFWEQTFTEKQLIAKFKSLNPSLEVSTERTMHLMRNCIDKGNCTSTLNNENQSLCIQFKLMIENMAILWEVYGEVAPADTMFHHMTRPLLGCVLESERREAVLFKGLQTRDKELRKIVAETGAKLSPNKVRDGYEDLDQFRAAMDNDAAFTNIVASSANGPSALRGVERTLFVTVLEKQSRTAKSPAKGDEDAPKTESSVNASSSARNSDSSPQKQEGVSKEEEEQKRRDALRRKLSKEGKKTDNKRKKKGLF